MFKFNKEHIIDSHDKLEAFDDYIKDFKKSKGDIIAFDTETNGLDFKTCVVIGFSLSTERNTGYYIPLLQWTPVEESSKKRKVAKKETVSYMEGCFTCTWTGETYPEFVTSKDYKPPEFISQLLKSWTSGVNLIMHNAPFDCNMIMYNMGFDMSKNLLCDTILLKHVIDENTKSGLKDTGFQWADELGYSAAEDARMEQQELGSSIIKNGGTFNMTTKHIWRGDTYPLAKYAAKDTALTLGLFEVGLSKLESEYEEKHISWFFEDEVMPLCREVMTPFIKYKGVHIDVEYFKELEVKTKSYMEHLEDTIIGMIDENLSDFDIGKSMEEAVSDKKLVEKMIEMEGLKYPTQTTKGEVKKSLAKKAVQAAYQENPHWVYGYLLGEDELKYSKEELHEIKTSLYQEALGRRYRFNISSNMHLIWLFCDKLKTPKSSLPQTPSATPENPIPSLSAETLEEVFLNKYEFVKPLLTYKKLSKLYNGYILPALTLNHNGWLTMDFKQHGTTSGRFSCSGGFNLQTLPRVEEIGKCTKCESTRVSIEYPIPLIAKTTCKDCGHEEDVICYSTIKRGFTAPKGYKIINADYSSLEPRCFAFMSGDDKLKEVYRKDLDLYSKVYCDLKGQKYRDLKKSGENANRNIIKPVVLGIPYGARGPQVASLMNLKTSYIDRDTGEKKEYLDVEAGIKARKEYLDAYPNLNEYMEECELECISKGYVETIVGRRRHFNYATTIHAFLTSKDIGLTKDEFLDMSSKELKGTKTSFGLTENQLKDLCYKLDVEFENKDARGMVRGTKDWKYIRNLYKGELDNAKNFKIQGLAAHITNKAMLDTTRLFIEHEIDGYVCLQVHDEITCYAREDQAELAASLLKQGMEENSVAKLLDIPMLADPVICDNIKDAK